MRVEMAIKAEFLIQHGTPFGSGDMTARCVACHRRRTHVRPPAAPTTRFARSSWRAPLPCCPFVGFVLADNPDGFHLIALPGGLALRMAALLDGAYPRAADPGGLAIGPFNRSNEEKRRVQDLVLSLLKKRSIVAHSHSPKRSGA
jgi:hypothetical protein